MIRPNRLAGLAVGALCRVSLAAFASLGSCSPAPPATQASALRAPPAIARPIAQHEPLRGYRLAESFVARGPILDGAPLRLGAIVNGLRVRPNASGLHFAESEAMPALISGVPVPELWGGGFLFWNDTALYTAEAFLGPLSPLFEVGFQPWRVSFGPSFVLVRGADGERLALDLRTRRRVTIAPPLLADIAVTPAGRALALLEGGGCQLSVDAGKSYQPLALPAGTRALGVREASGQLLASLTSNQQMRVDSSGNLQLEGAPRASPRPAVDSLWPVLEPPLERALAAGVPIGEGFAGVAVAGSVATVNLRTGELVQVTRALVPSELSCRALDVNGALLLACHSRSEGSVVLSDVFGARPHTQAKFASGVRLDFAEGMLVASARCDGQLRPGAICVLAADGRLTDFDASVQLAKLAQLPPQTKPETPTAPAAPGAEPVHTAPPLVRWIPKVGGGAVAVIGGSAPGLLEVPTGNFVPISPEALKLASPTSALPDDWLGLNWIALADGSVRGWSANSAVAITSDGRLEPSVYLFRQLSGVGARALAIDLGQRVFQSVDWGRSWVETLGPPRASGDKQALVPRCSQVGCLLGPWLRVGWEAEVPGARVRGQQVASAPPGVSRETLPILSCEQLAGPVVAELPEVSSEASARPLFGIGQRSLAREEDDAIAYAWLTVHPVHSRVSVDDQFDLRASLVAHPPSATDPDPLPANWPGYSIPARISFVSAFDPSGRIQSASVTWRALMDAASPARLKPSVFQAEAIDGDQSLPVLGRNPGEAEGLILGSYEPLWVRGSAAVAPLFEGLTGGESKWISAVQTAPNKLALLAGDRHGSLDVLEFAAGRTRRLFQMPGLEVDLYPANPDALAIGAHGELAILRTPSGREPATAADPALLFHQDGSVSRLAPWSRLFLADSPECKPLADDYRALLQTSRAWLRLIDAAQATDDAALQAGMFAMLRGNSERLCLEAVELAASPVQRADSSHATRLAARFVGRGRGAARLGFDSGFEFRQPLSCRLAVTR